MEWDRGKEVLERRGSEDVRKDLIGMILREVKGNVLKGIKKTKMKTWRGEKKKKSWLVCVNSSL